MAPAAYISDSIVALRNGQIGYVPHSSVSWPHGGLGGGKLLGSGPDRIVLHRTLLGYVLSLVLMGVGTCILVCLWQMAGEEGTVVGVVLAGLLGSVFVLVGLAGLFGYFCCLRLFRADRRTGKITLLTRSCRRRTIPFDNVAAVQLTWCFNSRSPPENMGADENWDKGYLTWEINLVLEDPPLDRIPLFNRSGRQTKALAEAERLAGLLGVPLLDHS